MAVEASNSERNHEDALASWNDGSIKQSIFDFVARTTTEGTSDYVPPGDRLAVFDNDGTLWVEQPLVTQLAFFLDDARAQAPKHPEWKTTEPFKSVLDGNLAGIAASGESGIMEVVAATQCGMTTAAFNKTATDWINTARHPKFDRLYTRCVFQPMLELLAYLKAHGFTSYIVTGGGSDFVRPWAERVYGVPSQHVLGSSLKTKFEMQGEQPVLIRQPAINLLDDGPGKPVGIHEFIGKQPIFAAGNSDGDLPMLQWTAAGSGPRLLLLVHHTDAEREYAYTKAALGNLDKALQEAQQRGWSVVDIKRDWNTIFPTEEA